MAGKLKTDEDWQEYDQQRIAFAVKEIAASDNLRYFFRELLSQCGHQLTPFAHNAIETARLCGRHEVALEIIATLTAHEPGLYPNLLLESHREQTDRGA